MPRRYNNLGSALQEQGKLDEADRQLPAGPASEARLCRGALTTWGVLLQDQGKLEEAIANYRQALRLKPDYAEAYNNLGNALQDQGKLEEAVGQLRAGPASEAGQWRTTISTGRCCGFCRATSKKAGPSTSGAGKPNI